MGVCVDDQYRLSLIEAIERKRGSRVISYICGTRPGLHDMMSDSDVRVIEHHLAALSAKKPPAKLDLFLYTPGGLAVVPTAIVALIREHLGPKGEFSVLIPAMAFSAGTVLSLGADEIVMNPAGHIGPIDTQMDGVSVDTLRAYFDLARSLGLRGRRDMRDIFLKMTDEVSPLWYGIMQKVSTEGERKAIRVLNTRKRPLSKRQNKRIVKFLTHEVGIHGQAIHRSEAQANGLDFVSRSEQYGIRDEMAELFTAYENMLELDVPLARKSWPQRYMGDEHDIAIDGTFSMEKPLSLVESRERLDVAKLAYGLRFWRDAPPPPGRERARTGDEVHASPIASAQESLRSVASGQRSDGMKSGPPRMEWETVERGK